MINSILQRRHRASGYTDTEIAILRAAVKLFLEHGYSTTTLKQISNDAGVLLGNVCYYFKTKEDILYMLIEELLIYHSNIINKVVDKTGDKLFSYATEIAMQIVLCEENMVARDIYKSGYSSHGIMRLIVDWGAEKNRIVFGDRLPDWTEQYFKNMECISAHIEFSAMEMQCNDSFTLDNKISLVLNSLMKNYEVPEAERKSVIEKILDSDYKQHAQDVFKQFVERFEKSA